MPLEITHVEVTDFAEAKRVFDSRADIRTAQGALSSKIYQSDDNPKAATIVIEWDSLDSARKYTDSAELKPAIKKAGIVGTPISYYLNET